MRFLSILVGLGAAFILSGCIISNAPVTDRTQLVLVDAKKEKALGLSEAESILKNATLSANKTLTNKIVEIGKRIVAVSDDAKQYEWDFYLLEDPTINAFALPGGKVFFYTGILKLMSNDDQIATVMGHEIAHVLAHHGAERMSQQMVSNVGAQILSSVLNIPAEYKGLYSTAYGIASNVGVILPFSRKHESEADTIGVYLMKKAGYNPNEAVKFWQKMAEASRGSKLEFLSTHPSDERRIKDIEAYIKTLE
ncbi:MAG: M48 family metallopeptidase [Campylobacteraceae bacterium]|jgi:predicted Zn-dependent protease|nr:M48 family metallopeptidase [Campylobacteraceae bacterium]